MSNLQSEKENNYLKKNKVMDCDLSSTIARVGAKGRSQGGGSQETIEKKRSPRNANFMNQEIDLLVILVGDRVKARRDNSQSNVNPSVEEWNYIHSQFNFRSTKESREKQALKNKWKTLRSEYSFFKDLASRSGHGWNEEKGIPDLTEEAWDDYIKMDARRYKPFRNKTFPWFRAMEEICGNSIATGHMQHSSDPSVPIAHNFHSESSDDDRNGDDVSPVEIQNSPIDLDVNETFDFFSDFRDLGSGHVPCQTQHANTSSSPVEIEPIRANVTAEKRKSDEVTRAEFSATKRSNLKNSKTDISQKFLDQYQSRNESLNNVVDHMRKNPKYGGVQKEVIDRLKSVLDPKQPTYHNDYYDMIVILENDWVRGYFMNESDDMLKGYVDYMIHRHRTGQSLNPQDPPSH